MIQETIYSEFDLKKGKCTCCGERSKEILIGDGRCVDCIEEEKFIEQTMKQAPRIANHRSRLGCLANMAYNVRLSLPFVIQIFIIC